jgi:hypothetical protein
MGEITVILDAPNFWRERAAWKRLALEAAVLSAPFASDERVKAAHDLHVFCTKQAALGSRRYAAMFPKWDPRRWKALWDARRCERELAEAGEGE